MRAAAGGDTAGEVIRLGRCSKWYGEVIGLNDVTCSIGHGITGLLGPNGAGKTTLMGLVTGQLQPSRGEIRVYGRRPWDNPRVLGQIGFCPEGDPFWLNMTGWQFVFLLVRIAGLRGRAARSATAEAIARVGLTEHERRAIRGYSKGMRQRIKIAQALAHRPRLIVLDEPFTGADPVSRRELAALFRSLADEGVDILVSSHVLHEVEALTQQLVMIDHGRIVAEGDLRTVRRQLHNRPHTIRVRVDRPRELAEALVRCEPVSALQVVDEQTLLIQTRAPEPTCAALAEAVQGRGLVTREIAAADESLEAVFDYLTDRRGR